MDLSLADMDDAGMWVWAAVITLVGLVASFGVAVWWQRWKDKKKDSA